MKHIERCRVIIHLLDASQGEEAIVENYTTIRSELEKWSSEMAEKEELILLSKKDIVDPEMLDEMKAYFEKKTGKKIFLSISAGAYLGIDELKDLLIERIPETKYTPPRILEDEEGYLTEQATTPESSSVKTYDLKRKTDPKRCTITRREDGDFEVTGERIEEITRMTDIRYVDGVNRVYDVMEKLGVIRKIKLLVQNDMLTGVTGFFEGEEDMPSPNVYIAGKKFSLENIIFMK